MEQMGGLIKDTQKEDYEDLSGVLLEKGDSADNNEKKRALITGITGQDGAYLAKFLLEKGYEVCGLARRLSTPNFWRLQHLEILPKMKIILADLGDMSSLLMAIETFKPNEIYNLAAQSFVGASFDQPINSARINGIGLLNILEIVKHAKWPIKVYQASTSEMYGSCVSKDNCQNEETVMKPNSPYGIAKLFAYEMMRIYRRSYGIFACNGILFNHESELRGLEFVTRKITNAVAKIKFGLQNELKLGNLDARRDWGYAPEYIEAMWKIMQDKEPKDYVIATGETHSVKEFAEVAFSLVGLNWEDYVKIEAELKRPYEIEYLKGNNSKAKKELGWAPKVTFKELVKRMVEADLKRWERYRKGELFPWDAPNFPEEIEYLVRKKDM